MKLARIEGAGLEKIVEVLPLWRQAQESFLSAVGDADWNVLATRLDGLRDGMSEHPRMRAQLRRGLPAGKT